ncbi:MAG: PAS domain S-box protein, partial [Pedobacter sp.]|nr:PAS domain S-box protein [Pedobacter sp.]
MLTNNPYHEIFRLTPLPTVLLSVKDGIATIVDMNLAYLELIGANEAAMVGEDFMTFVDAAAKNPIFHHYSAAIKKSVSQVLATKKINTIKLDLKKIEIQNTPTLNKDGELEFIMHVVKPFGNQQTNEKLLSLIVSNTEEAFIVLNKDLLITSFNERFYELYLTYFKIEVMAGESILLYAQPDRVPLLEKLYRNVLAGNVEHSEINIQYEGVDRKIAIKYSPIRNELREVFGIFVTVADVTAITNFEVQLKTREQELSLIFDNLNEIVFLINVEENCRFKFKAVNKSFILASGLTTNQLEDKYVEEIIPEPSLSLVLSKYLEAIALKESVSWEETTTYPTGK